MVVHSRLRWCFIMAVSLTVLIGVLGIFRYSVTSAADATGGKDAKDAAAVGEWARWRGPNNDGISKETGWSTKWPEGGPKVLWKASVGNGYSAFSISGGRAYTMGNARKTDTVYCFNAATGEVIWTHSYPCPGGDYPGPRATPTVDGKRVYTLSYQGHLFCLDTEDGKILWSRNAQKEFGAKMGSWGFAGSSLVVGDLLIVDVGTVVALNKVTGKLVWKAGNDKAGYSSPVVFTLKGKRLLATFNASGLVVRSLLNKGRELYRLKWKTAHDVNAVTPIVSGDKIFISSSYNKGCAMVRLGGAKPRVVWQNKKILNHFSTCVLYKGHLYGIGDKKGLRCLDLNTSDVKWTKRGFAKGGLMMADGKLIIMAQRGDLVIAEATPKGYKELSRARVLSGVCWTYPVLCAGRIYCRNRKGAVVCLDVSGKKR